MPFQVPNSAWAMQENLSQILMYFILYSACNFQSVYQLSSSFHKHLAKADRGVLGTFLDTEDMTVNKTKCFPSQSLHSWGGRLGSNAHTCTCTNISVCV